MMRRDQIVLCCFVMLALFGAAPAYAQCVVPAPGEVARYQGDGDATDSIGTNDGVLINGASFGPGLLDQAFAVDGSDDYVEVADAAELDLTIDFALAAWVNPDVPADGGVQAFVSKPRIGGNTGYRLSLDAAGRPEIGLNDGGVSCVAHAPVAAPAGEWTHVAGVYGNFGSLREARIFVNGQLVGAVSCATGPLQNSAEPLQIGREFAVLGGRHFGGAIDQVRLFEAALTDGDVRGLFDPDCDGVGDNVDNCPLEPNPGQEDFDADGQGDACDGDTDGDGTADEHDQCDFTPPGEVVGQLTGCSIAELCPCDGPFGSTGPWHDHGHYVACVAITATSFRFEGLISQHQKAQIIRDAAHSDCGP